MEAIKHIKDRINKSILRAGWVLLLLLWCGWSVHAQPGENTVSFKNGKLYITIQKESNRSDLAEFIAKFNLDDLALFDLVSSEETKGLKEAGWKIVTNDRNVLVISKAIEALGDFSKSWQKIRMTDVHGPVAELYPLGVNTNLFGYNQLKNEKALQEKGDSMVFFLPGYDHAAKVELAGSFSRWQYEALPLKKINGGWTLALPLNPGKHFYKYIVDGAWINDPGNQQRENDGKGNNNSVAFMPNKMIRLSGYENKRKVFLAGSFNKWQPRTTPMKQTADGWELPVFLPEGTHTYRFVVDNEWLTDPQAKAVLPNEFGELNGVIQVGKPYVFRLDGFQDVEKVILSGSFNGWKNYELEMEKKSDGWEILYTPGKGNHSFHFLADGQEVGPESTGKKGAYSDALYQLVVEPNYSFLLDGFENAKQVFIAGTFNQWSEKGFPMHKNEKGQWEIKLQVPEGKSSYKFLVDGQWMIDPKNPYWEQNEVGTKNSVLWFDLPGLLP